MVSSQKMYEYRVFDLLFLGESQPVYEEFGSILLLVLTIVQRYELTPSEIGSTSTTSFVRQLLESEAVDESIEELDESKTKHLGDWIAALFVADSLSDELTSTCSPHEFYKLVPTLLSQSLEACASGKMSVETLKTGFDCQSTTKSLPYFAFAKSHRPSGALSSSLARHWPEMACK